MDNGLIINHTILLTKEQKEKLTQKESSAIEVIGVSVPVWIRDGKADEEPSDEIFCHYFISNYQTATMVLSSNDGYIINIGDKDIVNSLKDIKNGGIGHIHLEEFTAINEHQVIHQLHISSFSNQLKS